RAAIIFSTDAAPNNGTTSLPTAVSILTGSTSAPQRVVVASTGAPTHNCDTGAGYTWHVNGPTPFHANAGNGLGNSPVPLIAYDTEARTTPAKSVRRKERAGGAVANGDVVGSTEYQSHDATSIRVTAKIRSQVDGAVSSGNAPCNFVISTGTTTR